MTERSQELLQDVAEATRLREGPEGVATTLRAIYHSQPIGLAALAREVRLPLPVATAVRRELEKRGLLERNQGVALTAAGKAFVEDTLGTRAAPALDFATEELSAQIAADPRMARALQSIARHAAAAPRADVTLDQTPCAPETALRRALLLLRKQGLNGRRAVFVGDDDLISVAVGITARAMGLGDSIGGLTVLDVDPRQLGHISAAAEAEGLRIECVRHDLREPLPVGLAGAFDVFETDPPYTLAGAELFLSRGIEALKPGSGYRALLSFAELPPDDSLDLQGLLGDLGLVAMGVYPGFNRYQGATVLGSAGRCYDLLTTTAAISPPRASSYDGPLYTAEVTPRSALYRCLACATTTPVGPSERFKLISQLKQGGCPHCGTDCFKRIATLSPRTI
jgi:hypothetical protein